MARTYTKTDTPSPSEVPLLAGDLVTFTSVQEDPEKSRRGAEIHEGVVVLRGAWGEPRIVESTLGGKKRTDAKKRRDTAREWKVGYVRLRIVRRDGDVVAKLPHILGDR